MNERKYTYQHASTFLPPGWLFSSSVVNFQKEISNSCKKELWNSLKSHWKVQKPPTIFTICIGLSMAVPEATPVPFAGLGELALFSPAALYSFGQIHTGSCGFSSSQEV